MDYREQLPFLELRNITAEHTNRLIAWVGSGLSQPAGLPGWEGLLAALLRGLEKKALVVQDESQRKKLLAKLETAKAEKDLWVAFEILESALGRTTYTQIIRRELEPAVKCEIPDSYRLLWELPLAGVINLNLDGLATRACRWRFRERQVYEFSGTNAGNYAHVLKSPFPFILNLHGFHGDVSTWVLRQCERKELERNSGCSDFVSACLIGKTVLFLGVTADDTAVASYLEKLIKNGVDFGSHFWISSRKDPEADKWAQQAGVQAISYKADNKHSELMDMLRELVDYCPRDTEAHPVAMEDAPFETTEIPSPTALHQMPPEDARKLLNARACALLSSPSREAYEEYARFCRDYGLAIHDAWYVDPPHNTVFGYKLEKTIGRGAFASVFEARSEDGKVVAIKLLRGELRENERMFQSFRRGVRSMRILSQHQLHGIVPYEDASEIPAAVIMEVVDGPNLHDAVLQGNLGEWSVLLKVACELAHIIRSAHLLPERVLHRDIRPPNVMLRGYYTTPEQWEVVVLDFDLSWHLGAKELSVLDHSALNGYLAPEQVERMAGSSTRNALVDSFGLGMTLYFMRTKKEPQYLEQRQATWESKVLEQVVSHKCSSWRSLPYRYARLILNCTQDKQNSRWDVTQVEAELRRVLEAVNSPKSIQSSELLAEEIAARAAYELGDCEYSWDADRMCATIRLPGGIGVDLLADETNCQVIVQIQWIGQEGHSVKNLEKYLPEKCKKAEESLRKHGWRIRKRPALALHFAEYEATKLVGALRADMARAVRGVTQAARALQFGPREG